MGLIFFASTLFLCVCDDQSPTPDLEYPCRYPCSQVLGNEFDDGLLLFHAALDKKAAGLPLPQGGGGAGGHGQPQAGSPSTPGPGGGTAGSGASSTIGAAGGGASGSGTGAAGGSGGVGFGVHGENTGGGAGGGAAGGGAGWSAGPVRRGRGWRDWRRGDPTLIKGLWKSKGPLDSLGNAEAYIFLALLIGFVTVVVGCWLSDNCWSPEPEGVVTVA